MDQLYFTISNDFVQIYVVLVGHIPQEGEDHEAREEARQGVDGAGDDGISGSRKKKIRTQNVRHEKVRV